MQRLFFVVWLSLTGCAPLLSVVHRDPTHPHAEVRLDGQSIGGLQCGGRLAVRVERGVHQLELVSDDPRKSPWTDDGRAVTVVVDGNVEVTLVTPEAAP